jgi:hypothetical protein
MQCRQKQIGNDLLKRVQKRAGGYSKRIQKRTPEILEKYFELIFEELTVGNSYNRCNNIIQIKPLELSKDLLDGDFFVNTYPYKKFIVSLGTDFEEQGLIKFAPKKEFSELILKGLSNSNGCQKIVNKSRDDK